MGEEGALANAKPLSSNQSLFKQQLATRAVDKRNIVRQATRTASDYFQPLKTVAQTDLEPMKGKDPAVLDRILVLQAEYAGHSVALSVAFANTRAEILISALLFHARLSNKKWMKSSRLRNSEKWSKRRS